MPDSSYIFSQVMQRYAVYPLKESGYFYHSQVPPPASNKEFISVLLRSFEDSNEEKPFNATAFDPFPIELVVDYIQHTHAFYLQKKLPEIAQSILLLSGHYESNHPILVILQTFFHRYCRDLTRHISEEEKLLLPYIVHLNNAILDNGHLSEFILTGWRYSVETFQDSHHDTEDELKDIRDTIRLYQPPVTNESLYRILLSQLEAFEQDLHVHAQIEERVLIPKAVCLERELNEHLLGNGVRN
jgi:regulator of cell morphogenesis and NO signaling